MRRDKRGGGRGAPRARARACASFLNLGPAAAHHALFNALARARSLALTRSLSISPLTQLRGTSVDKPAVCKYTGLRYYSDDWASAH